MEKIDHPAWYRRLSDCEGKESYATKGAAMTVIRRITRKPGRRRPHELNAYRCVHCGQFHIGNRH